MSDLELIYWPGFSGRLEPIQFLLEVAKVKYSIDNKVPDFIKNSPEPVFACPIIKDGDLILSQTIAIMVYLAEKYGFEAPADKKAHALMAALNLGDVFSEGYNNRKKEDCGKEFLGERLDKWLAVAEGTAKKHGGKYLFGDKLTYVDFIALNIHNSLVFMFGTDYSEKAKKCEKLFEIFKNIKTVPEIAAFTASDRYLPVLYGSIAASERK